MKQNYLFFSLALLSMFMFSCTAEEFEIPTESNITELEQRAPCCDYTYDATLVKQHGDCCTYKVTITNQSRSCPLYISLSSKGRTTRLGTVGAGKSFSQEVTFCGEDVVITVRQGGYKGRLCDSHVLSCTSTPDCCSEIEVDVSFLDIVDGCCVYRIAYQNNSQTCRLQLRYNNQTYKIYPGNSSTQYTEVKYCPDSGSSPLIDVNVIDASGVTLCETIDLSSYDCGQ